MSKTEATKLETYSVSVQATVAVYLEVEAASVEEARAKAFEWRCYEDGPFTGTGYWIGNDWHEERFEMETRVQDSEVVAFLDVQKVMVYGDGEAEQEMLQAIRSLDN